MSAQRHALIFGGSGQDGSYLSDLLLKQGWKVTGTCQNVHSSDPWRLRMLGISDRIELISCALSDEGAVRSAVTTTKPDAVFNVAAISSLEEARENPDLTIRINGTAVGWMLDELFDQNSDARFFQASSAQIFGSPETAPQTETSVRSPENSYAEAKILADENVDRARSQGHFAVSGILYNHESPLRTERFVSRKIASGLVDLLDEASGPLEIGSLDAVRDWSFAKDFMEGAVLAVEASAPDQYIFASGVASRVRDWINYGAEYLGLEINWSGQGIEEEGRCARTGRLLVKVDPKFYRAIDPARLIGDPSKARSVLGWTPKMDLQALVHLMIDAERSQRN